MKILWQRIPLALARPFRTATAYRTHKETLWVRVQYDGLEGWGEAVPVDTYGQTLETAEAALPGMAELLKNQSPYQVEKSIHALIASFATQRATIAAIDAAIHDWLGKRHGLPVCRWLGLDPDDLPTSSFTIGIDDLDTIAEKVREAAEYPILKVKLGTPDDERILKTVRQGAPEKRIRVDANTAWRGDEAPERVRMLAAFGVELLEQPVPRDDLDGLRRYKECRKIPVMADESCVTPADVVAVAPHVDGINIKMSKCGGLREAIRMIHLARGLDLRVMFGCMIEGSLGIAAAAHLGPAVDFLDLDGHILLSSEPFTGLAGAGGRLAIAHGPGLGIRLHD